MRRVCVALALASAPAAADPAADHAQAARLFEEGRRLMGDHDPHGACEKFDEAIRIEPLAAGVMLNLGLCNEELGHKRVALMWFRKAIHRATESDPPLPEYEREAREHTAKLASEVATIQIAFTRGNADDAVVTLDGEPVAPADFPRVELDPGHHVVVARAPGKLSVKRELDVDERGGQVVALELQDLPPDPGAPQKQLALYAGAGGAALLATSLAVTLYEKHIYNQNKDAALGGSADALAKTHHANDVAADWGTGLAVCGFLAAGAAVYLYMTAPERPADTIAIVPAPGGILAVGSF